MAVVVYKCSVCNRTVELTRKPNSLEVVQRCIITHGCRGKLFQVNVLEDFVRGRPTLDVVGLDNWQKRKLIHNHNQSIDRQTWNIKHNLGSIPTYHIYVDRPTQDNPSHQEEIEPQTVDVISDNEISFTFNRPWSGQAHLVATSTNADMVNKPLNTVTLQTKLENTTQITISHELTIAIRMSDSLDTGVGNIKANVTNAVPMRGVYEQQYTIDNITSIVSPWVETDVVLFRNRRYKVRSFTIISDPILHGVISSGSTWSFKSFVFGTSVVDIVPDTFLILLASKPYTSLDRSYDRYVDIYDLISSPAVLESSELLIPTSLIRQTYPHIRVI